MKYDIVGDIHGCFQEFKLLLETLGYKNGIHPERHLILTGDLTDRGPDSVGVLKFVMSMYEKRCISVVRGNHDDKLMRWTMGRNVIQSHGLDKTIEQIKDSGLNIQKLKEFIEGLPFYMSLDGLVVVHAAFYDKMLERDPFHKKNRTWAIFGPTTGKTLENGLPDRIDWAINREVLENSPVIAYGHQLYKDVRIINKTYGIDTGCVFGGYLTALRYPEMELVQVKSHKKYNTGGFYDQEHQER